MCYLYRVYVQKVKPDTGDGLCLLTKRLERGRFAWPSARDDKGD
ncbi:IS66 family insertion sequence element accessory protein TnpB [Salmonella enterica]